MDVYKCVCFVSKDTKEKEEPFFIKAQTRSQYDIPKDKVSKIVEIKFACPSDYRLFKKITATISRTAK